MEEPVSKSQKKREAEALTKLGVQLVELKVSVLDSLPLPEPLYKAILEAKKIKSFGAKKRQALLIGKLMRGTEAEAIVEAYAALVADSKAQTADFHELEIWRDRLIQEGNPALTAFIAEHEPSDIQFLRQLIKKAVDEHMHAKNIGAAKALFRYLRSCVS